MFEYTFGWAVSWHVKAILSRIVIALVIATSAVSCTTMYDEYGRPQQVVEPGAAVAGALAIGLLAYALSESDDDDYCEDRHYERSYRRRHCAY
jgi:hypothetical protein